MSDALVSMKLKRPAVEASTAAPTPDRPVYPWGLSVVLDSEALEKLDLDEIPEVGASLMLVARVDVVGVSVNENAGAKPSRSMTLQITHLCLEESADDAADVLYGKG